MRIIITGLVAGVIVLGGAAAIAQTAPVTPAPATPAPGSTASTETTTSHTAKAGRATSGHASTVRGSFATEADAKSHCPSDTVVWGNPGSKVLHVSGSKAYGKTKRGGYMCESEAIKAGYHVAKGEKHS